MCTQARSCWSVGNVALGGVFTTKSLSALTDFLTRPTTENTIRIRRCT